MKLYFPLQIWKDSIISYFVLFCSFSYSNLSSIRLSKISAPALFGAGSLCLLASVRLPLTFHRVMSVGLLLTSPMLAAGAAGLVGLDGLEPSTSRLSGARSSHLSYRPLSYSRALIRITFRLHGFVRLPLTSHRVMSVGFLLTSPILAAHSVGWWR